MIKPSILISVCLFFLFVLCPLVFFTDLTRNPYYTQIVALNILVCLVWLLVLGHALMKGELVWVSSPLDIPLWALMGVCALSWISSFIQHPNFRTPIYSEGSRAYIFLIVNTYLVYATAVRYENRDRVKWILWMVYAVSVIASVYGLAQYYGSEWFWGHTLNPYGSRPVSTFGNPNFMSSYLVIVLPVVIADYVFQITGLARVPLMIVTLISLLGLLVTLTRSSWIGAFVAILFVVFAIASVPEIWPKIRTPVMVMALALVLSVAALPKSSTAAYSQTFLGRLTEVSEATKGPYGSVMQRLLIWSCAWGMVQDHPILGKGWGCFELFYPFYQGGQLLQRKSFVYFRTHANNAHNEVLEYWSQIGTVGLGVIILLWCLFFRSAASISARLALPWKSLVWGFAGGVAGMLVDNLLNVSAHFAVPAFLLWWWVGSVFTLEPASLTLKPISLQSIGKKGVVLFGMLVLIGFSVRSVMMWEGEIHFFKGFKLSKAGVDLTTAARELETAYGYHHLEVNNNYELANVYARLQYRDKALAMYQRALDANAGYDEIYFNRATMYMQMGLDDEAIRNYQICLGINPLSREGYNALGNIYMKNIPKYGDAAEAMYQKALTVFPEDKDLWGNLGYLEVQRQHLEAAYQAYHKAVEVDPDFDTGLRNLTAIVAKTGHPDDPYLTINARVAELSRILNEKQWDQALEKGKAFVELVPRSARAHFYLGNAYFNLNRVPEAAAEFAITTQLKPETSSAWQDLAVCYDRLNRTEEAVDAWNRVHQLDPNNPMARARLKLP